MVAGGGGSGGGEGDCGGEGASVGVVDRVRIGGWEVELIEIVKGDLIRFAVWCWLRVETDTGGDGEGSDLIGGGGVVGWVSGQSGVGSEGYKEEDRGCDTGIEDPHRRFEFPGLEEGTGGKGEGKEYPADTR